MSGAGSLVGTVLVVLALLAGGAAVIDLLVDDPDASLAKRAAAFLGGSLLGTAIPIGFLGLMLFWGVL